MRVHASGAIPTHTGGRSKTRRGLAPVVKQSDLVAVVLFALAGLCLSVGAPLLLPDMLGTDEQGSVIGS